jgi:molybdopterin-binding protein
MRDVVATVVDIQSNQRVHKVYFEFAGTQICMLSLELSLDIKKGTRVKLTHNPNAIAIAKTTLDFSAISYENILLCKIASISQGEILTVVELQIDDITFEAIISTTSLKSMGVGEGDSVYALLKASALAISEVCDD